MIRKVAFLAATLLLSLAPRLYALGLGTVSVESALNQPLNARIQILQLGGVTVDQISVQMASPADFQRFNIDRVAFLSDIRFNIESGNDGVFVRLTSTQTVREPYLSFILDTRWPSGRILSEHTLLLDLPVFDNRGNTNVRQPISPVLQAPSSQPASTPTAPVTAGAAPTTAPVSTAPAVVPQPEVIEPQPEVIEPEPEVIEPEPEPVSDQAAVEPEPEPEVVAADPEPEVVAAEPEPQPVVNEIAEPEPEAVVQADEPVEPAAQIPDTLTTGGSDTLWDIALRVRPNDSVSVQQTMLALQRLNPDAFIGGNINMLRSGQVLRIPDLSEIQSMDQQTAVSEVTRQNQQASVPDVQPLAAPAPDRSNTPDQPSGQLSVVTSDDGSASGVGSALEQENAELDARIAALENQLAVREEEVDRARVEREELISRLDDLESQIASAMEIITLQDMQLAQLQESMAEAAEQAAAQAAATPPPATQGRSGLLDNVMGMLASNGLILIGGVAVIVLALVALLLRRNKGTQAKFDEDLDDLVEQESVKPGNAVPAAAAVASVARQTRTEVEDDLSDILNLPDEYDEYTREDEEPEAGNGEILEQADEMIAAGQLISAAGLLQDAVAEDRNNVDLQLKLLEVYAEQDNALAFDELASELDRLESEEIASSVAALRSRLSPPEEEEAAAEPEADEEETNALDAVDDDSSDDMDFDLDSLDVDETRAPTSESAADEPEESFDFNLSDLSEEEPASTRSAETPIDDDHSLDMTFEIGGGDDEPVVQSATEAPAEADVGESLEFSLDDIAKPGLEPESEAVRAEPDVELEAFDFSLDSETDKTVVEPKAENLVEGDDADLEEFDFDLDSGDTTTKTEVATSNEKVTADAVDEEDEVSFDDVDFDIDDVEILDEEPAAPALADDTDNLDDLDFLSAEPETPARTKPAAVDDDLDFLTIDDEAATKLDLAYAYKKMGDLEGAREILEEVVKEGNDEQIKEAKSLLESMGK